MFYEYYGLLASPLMDRLQAEINMLMGLLNRARIQTNYCKTLGMIFQPCHTFGSQLDDVYTRRMTEVSPLYWEQQR